MTKSRRPDKKAVAGGWLSDGFSQYETTTKVPMRSRPKTTRKVKLRVTLNG